LTLLELLRNAHDAHPGERRDGQVHVVRAEGEVRGVHALARTEEPLGEPGARPHPDRRRTARSWPRPLMLLG
jgi:hypothetical protein